MPTRRWSSTSRTPPRTCGSNRPTSRGAQSRTSKLNEMFNTHPPLAERINLLRSMEGLTAYTGPTPEAVAALQAAEARQRVPGLPAPTTNLPGTNLPGTNLPGTNLPGANFPGTNRPGAALLTSEPGDAPEPTAASTMNFERIGQVAEQATEGATAGWYTDPAGQPLLRYWDGQQWTKHTARR